MSTVASDTAGTSASFAGSEYEASTTTMPLTTNMPARRISKRKVALGAGGVMLALLLLSLLLGGGYSAYKKRVSVPTVTPTVMAPKIDPAKLSPEGAEELQRLLFDIEGKIGSLTKKEKKILEQCEIAKNAVIHLQTVGDKSNKEMFNAWLTLAKIEFYRTNLFSDTGKYGKKMTPDQYSLLVAMRNDAVTAMDFIVKNLAKSAEGVNVDRAEADVQKLTLFQLFSFDNYNKLDAKVRKNKSLKGVEAAEGVTKSKKNKDLEKKKKEDVKASFVDVCLMRLARGVAEWPQK